MVFFIQVDNNFLPSEFKDTFKDQMSGIIKFVKDNPEDVVREACKFEAASKGDEESSTQVIEIHVQPPSLTKEDAAKELQVRIHTLKWLSVQCSPVV